MVMRGASPSAPCPRCGTIAPPTGDRLITCTDCKLAFDPTAERAAVSIRRNRGVALIEKLKVTRAPAHLTVSSAFERRQGVQIAAGGVGLIVGGIVYGVTTGTLSAGTLALITVAMTLGIAITMLGILFIAPHVIRVDALGISAGRRLGHRNTMLLTELGSVERGVVNAANDQPTFYVCAVSGTRPKLLLFTTRSDELADHVTRIVRDAVATMPTTSSPGTA